MDDNDDMDDVDDAALITVGGGASSSDHLPLSAITKLAKDSLPDSFRCAADVPLLVRACVSEYVQMLTAQANEQATAGWRTISAMSTT